MTASIQPTAADVVGQSHLVLDCLPRAIVIADLGGVILALNRVAEHLYGSTAADAVGRRAAEVVFAGMDPEEAQRIVTLAMAGETWTGDITLPRSDGATNRTYLYVGPLRDEHDRVVGTISSADEIPERRWLEQRASDLSDHLVLALAAGELGTWRWDRATGVTVWDPTMERIFGLEPGTFDGTYEAWVGLLHPDDVESTIGALDRAVADKAAYEVEHRVIRPDGSVRWLHGRGKVTLDPDGNVTGTIGCTGDVTARKQLEIDADRRACEAERAAERERLQRERLEFLTALDDGALAAADYRQLMRNAAAGAVPTLGDWCAVHYLPGPSTIPEVEVAHSDPAKIRWATELQERYPFDPNAPTGVPAVIRTGKLEFLRDLEDAFLEDAIEAAAHIAPRDELRTVVDALQPTGVITVPLRTKRGVVGAMQFVSAESKRRYDHEDVALAQAAAGRIAEALDNAWLTEQHRMIATTLQAALLPPRLPHVDGISVAVRYWAAGAVSEAGGDFYDLFAVDDRRWSIVIGDVCGTGPNAAAVTAIARHTIRAAAKHGATHQQVLDWVNEALDAGNRNLFCTAVYSTLEALDDESWEYTCIAGGHPLPLLIRADGSTTTIGHPGTLLGVMSSIQATPATTRLLAGDTVVLYTDGVTDVAPPHGLGPDALARIVADSARVDGSAEEVAARLGEAIQAVLPIPQRNDDVALVVLRVGS